MIGLLIGLGLSVLWWPHIPSGTSVPQSADVKAQVSDAYLSRKVQQHVAGIVVPQISNVAISSAPPATLIAGVDLGVGPFSVPGTLQVRPYAANGRVHVDLVSANVAGVPIPAPLIGALADSMNSAAQDLARPNARVVGVRVTPTGLEILVDYR